MTTNPSDSETQRAVFPFSGIVTALSMRHPTKTPFQVASTLGIAALIAAVGWLVYATGGIQFVYAHTMYLPVLVAAWFFGGVGGLFAGVAGGIVLGPWMPVDVALGTMQLPLNWTFRLIVFSAVGGGAGSLLDVVDRRAAHIRWLRSVDPITEIPNRLWLHSKLESMIREAPEGSQVILLTVNVDNYREIVDTFGPSAGDELVRETMNRLRAELPPEAAAGKLETNRLGVVLPDAGSTEWVIQALKSAFWKPSSYRGIPLYLDVSIGMVEFPIHGTDIQDLIQKAYVALYTAQFKTERFFVYEEQLDRTSKANLALLGELPEAIQGNDLQLHFQPIVSVEDGKFVAAEALVRWQHGTLGLVPPGRFIPQAENTGIINNLTSWVLRTALRQLSEWHARGLDVRMAINVSARVFYNRDVVGRVLALAERYGVSPGLIELEVTESAIMSDMDHTKHILNEFAEAGIHLSIDDFGTGYSSLQYLADLPVNALKIDQTFVRGMSNDEGLRKIVEATAHLAAELGLQTVAEGVEYTDDLPTLFDYGVDRAQGFAIARPQPPEDLEPFLLERAIRTDKE